MRELKHFWQSPKGFLVVFRGFAADLVKLRTWPKA